MSTLRQLLGIEESNPPTFFESKKHPTLKWIHLSDLHFGHQRDPAYPIDRRMVCAKLIDDIKEMISQVGQPDFIFITGDIAFSGDPYDPPQEYVEAQKWFDQLNDNTGISKDKILLVPGNHDIDRKKASKTYTSQTIHKKLRDEPTDINKLLSEVRDMTQIWDKIEAYANFTKHFSAPEITPQDPFWTTEHDTLLGKIIIVGLNSCLSCFDDKDNNTNLSLGVRQIEAIQAQHTDCLLIVLLHHPPSWLTDGNTLGNILLQRPHILFFGHIHRQEGNFISPFHGNGNKLVQFIAGAGHSATENSHKHGYSWGQINREGLKYFPRVWVGEEHKFKAAKTNYDTMKPDGSVFFSRKQLPPKLDNWLGSYDGEPQLDVDIAYIEGVIKWHHQPNALWLLKIEENIKNLTEQQLGTIIKKLKELSGDSEVKLLAIASGSVALVLKGTPEGFKKIKKLFNEKKLNSAMGLIVIAIDEVNGATLQTKVTPGETQNMGPVPDPNLLLWPTKKYTPLSLKGMGVTIKHPDQFVFMIETGDSGIKIGSQEFIRESKRMMDYFLAALSIKEDDLWVNLSAYESNRMIPNVLSETELGRDMLEIDCLLKRFTASLLHPESETGKEYWEIIFNKFGSTARNINTFQKIWIVPTKAVTYSPDPKDKKNVEIFGHLDKDKIYSYVVESTIDVLCEEDLLAFNENLEEQKITLNKDNRKSAEDINMFCNQLFKKLILPIIKKEINTGKTFATARQLYKVLILSTWYKKKFEKNPKCNLVFNSNKPRQIIPKIYSIEEKERDLNSKQPSDRKHNSKIEVDNIIIDLNKGDSDTLNLAKEQVRRFESKGDYKRASKIQEEIIRVCSQKYGKTHDDTLLAKRILGELLREDGKLNNAHDIHAEVFKVLNQLKGNEDFDTLVAMSQLGRTLRAMGEYNKACELHEEIVRIRNKTIGEHHPHTLLSISVLADSLRALGNLKSSKKYLQIVINHIDEIKGKNHKYCLFEIVDILDSHGETSGANNLLAKIIELESKALGKDHCDVLSVIQLLAERLDKQGDLENAKRLWNEIDERLRKSVDKKTVEKYGIKNISINDYFYNQYLQLFRIGIFKHVQKQFDATEQKIVTNTFFSGSIIFCNIPISVVN